MDSRDPDANTHMLYGEPFSLLFVSFCFAWVLVLR